MLNNNPEQQLEQLLLKFNWDKTHLLLLLLNEFEQYINYYKNDTKKQKQKTFQNDLLYLQNLYTTLETWYDAEMTTQQNSIQTEFITNILLKQIQKDINNNIT